MSKSRWFVVSALALAGMFGAGVARASHGADVQWSVTIGAPVYVRPAPVVAPPYPFYRVGDTYHGPYRHDRHDRHDRYYSEPTRWDRDGDGIPNRRDRVYNPRWDVDGDGIPNRHDRDRDGDGIPNWHDRDRDGDGIPNWHDRHDGRPWRR